MNENSQHIVDIPVDDVRLEGELIVPDEATGLVIFAHGSGSSRHSPRNNFVAEALRERGLATLLFDLLTEAEDEDRENRFDISLLTERLVVVSHWLEERDDIRGLTFGYFGSSTGAAAALRAAPRTESTIEAIVSRGGRVDLAEEVLDTVDAPTLFIVGGNDENVLELNQAAYEDLTCEKELKVVEDAGHLFEEPGALEEVANLAADWFVNQLG
jgi:alpha-beta hydrolase superfamily lysophospholipase